MALKYADWRARQFPGHIVSDLFERHADSAGDQVDRTIDRQPQALIARGLFAMKQHRRAVGPREGNVERVEANRSLLEIDDHLAARDRIRLDRIRLDRCSFSVVRSHARTMAP